MEQSIDDDQVDFSASLCEFFSRYTVEDLHVMNQQLDKKFANAKESKLLTDTAIEETQAEIDTIKQQHEDALVQIAKTRERIRHFKSKIQEAVAAKEASEEADRQRAEKEKESAMTHEQKADLREKLDMQRIQIDNLEDKIEELEKQKAENQKIYSGYRTALKDRKAGYDALLIEHEEVADRREYLISNFQSLQNTVEALREDVERLKVKLTNPIKKEADNGKTLFDEVTAEKKSLEVELVGIIEHTGALRVQIRLKQDELDELESHESENVCSVDTEYVLSKMRQLLAEDGQICEVMKKIEKEVHQSVCQVEQALKTPTDEQADLGAQYVNLRDYGLECVKVVSHECEEGIAKLKELFYDLEMLSVEYTNLQDRITQSKK